MRSFSEPPRPARLLSLLALGLLLLACDGGQDDGSASSTPGREASATPAGGRRFVEMVRARTGDSLEAFLPQRAAVAYIGVEAPANNTDCGRMATARNAELVRNGVFLEEEAGFGLDALGRSPFHAFTPAGENAGLTLVREGLARAADVSHRYRARYEEAMAQARAAGRGCLWGGGS